MRFQADIPGVGQIDVEGNFATNDSVQELIAIMRNQGRTPGSSTSFSKTAQDAEDGLASFSDELEDAEQSQKKLTDRVTGLAASVQGGTDTMMKFSDSGGNMTDVMDTMAPIIEDTARGIGGLVPILGEGLEELAGAAATAAFGLATAAVGMIEGFIGLNKQLYNMNLMGTGGFKQFADAAETAQIPVNEFASAMIQSTDKLRLFGSGAPGGIGQISNALGQLSRDGTLETLYSLGFTTEEVVAGMADYAVAAERSGRALSTPELAAGSAVYLKNLRELSRLTGVSVKEQQAEIDAQRANLFVQNQMLSLAPEQRAQAMAFASAIPEALVPIKDFIISGQSYNTESALMVSQMPTAATALRQAYQQIESGNLSASQAQELLKTTLENNRTAIDTELQNVTRTFGVAPQGVITEGEQLGAAILAITTLMNAAEAEVPAVIGGGEDSELNKALGNMEKTINTVQSEIQQSLITMTEGLSPVLNKFADGVDTIVTAIGDGKRGIESLFAGEEVSMQNMLQKLEDSLTAAITRGFNNVLGNTNLGKAFGFKDDEAQLKELQRLTTVLNNKDTPLAGYYNQYIDYDEIRKKIKELEAQGYSLDKINYTPDQGSSTENPEIEIKAALDSFEAQGYGTQKIDLELLKASLQSLEMQGYGTQKIDLEPLTAAIQSLESQGYGTQKIDLEPLTAAIQSLESQGYGVQQVNFSTDPNFPKSNSTMAANNTEPTDPQFADLKVSLDESKSLSDLVQLNRNMLQYLENASRRLDEMQSSMSQANMINRSSRMISA